MVCIKVALRAIKKQFEAEFTITDIDGPVQGFTVASDGKTGTTDAAGVCVLRPFKKGTYSVLATHPDYENISETFTAV